MSVFSIFILHSIILYRASFTLSLSMPTTSENKTDRLALLTFKSQLTETSQKALSTWNGFLHICEWEGVTCGRRHQRVTKLDLQSKGLEGPISPHIGNLSFLRKIELYNNSFHGSIPPQLGKLFRLEYLNLSYNSLVGEIPVNISLCSNLMDFRATHNNLIGKIPTELGFLSKLVILALNDNKQSGGLPSSIGNLTSLETLSLANNRYGGSIPSTLYQLKALKHIELGSCKLSGMFPPSLYNLSTLEIISVDFNRSPGSPPPLPLQPTRPPTYPLSGTLPTNIGFTLPNLKFLFMSNNQFSGHIPTSLFNISGIEKIDLGHNQFRGQVPPSISNLINLTVLSLGENNLGSGKPGDLNFITSLTSCRSLSVLVLSSNQFGGMIPSSIANFSNQLGDLYLSSNQISGNIPTGIENIKSLTLLTLQGNFITGIIPVGIGNLQNLGILDLSQNQLSGQIPSSITDMSQLFHLDLSYNNLEGSITSALGNQNLQKLYLSYNNLTGNIAKQDIQVSSHLTELDISHNFMNGSLPLDVSNLNYLESIDVSHNKLSGEIPSTLGSCSSLNYISFRGNFFDGYIPSSLSSLKGLEDLDLSNNNIFGEIPKELGKLSFLRYLNLSFNNLEGEVPMDGVFGNVTAFSVVGNHKVCGGISKLGLRKCQIVKSKKKGSSIAVKVILCVFIPSFVASLMLAIYSWGKPKAGPPSDLYVGDHRRVSYRDLHRATGGFSPTNLIGVGRYGSVYKGIVHQDEGPSAVKVLNLVERGAAKSFIAECEALRGIRHRNLLKILTVCSSTDFNGKDFKALVFEFMPSGSLESWLHPSPNEGRLARSLNFRQRLDIAFDVASALDYLHNDCDEPIVHCDLKPSNVLLSEDMTAHVGDFGLAKFLFKSSSISSETTAIRGTIGYIPPEYGIGAEVSKEGDVYSYGILLLELFTGKRPTDEMFKDGISLHGFCKAVLPSRAMDIIDTTLSYEGIQSESGNSRNKINECLNQIVGIGVACSVEPVHERMDIKQVLKEIHTIKQVLLCV